MSDVKRYGHISYLVDATPQILQLYPSMTVYVMASDYDALKAENESLRKDAERWQWVREQYWIQEVIDARLGDTPSVTEMEALIDANRSPENPS